MKAIETQKQLYLQAVEDYEEAEKQHLIEIFEMQTEMSKLLIKERKSDLEKFLLYTVVLLLITFIFVFLFKNYTKSS